MKNLQSTQKEVVSLTGAQQAILRQWIGHAKFIDLAKQAGCTVAAVREFTAVVFEERKRKQEEEYARQRAEQEAKQKAQNAQIDKQITAGNIDRARELWHKFYGESMIWESEEFTSAVDILANELRNEHDFEEEAAERITEEFNDELPESLQEQLDGAWEEYLTDTQEAQGQTAEVR
jgi:hypothetical protein